MGDLERALGFYRDGLGLESPGIIGTECPGDETHAAGAVATFQLQGGLILALYPRGELAKDGHVALEPPQAGAFSLGHAVSSRAAVDALLAEKGIPATDFAGWDRLDEHERAVLADLLALERHGLVKRVRGATPPLFAVTERGRLEAKR